MPLYHNLSLLFIHIPKTGGESIYSLLIKSDEQYNAGHNQNKSSFQLAKHDNYIQATIKLKEADINSQYETITVIRNPLDLVVSFYFHLRKPLENPSLKLMRPQNACKIALKSSFSEWIQKIFVDKYPQEEKYRLLHPTDHFADQTSFLVNLDNEIKINKIFRFEKLAEIGTYINQKYNTDVLMPHKNKSNRTSDFLSHYNVQTEEIIRNHYQRDFINFGY